MQDDIPKSEPVGSDCTPFLRKPHGLRVIFLASMMRRSDE